MKPTATVFIMFSSYSIPTKTTYVSVLCLKLILVAAYLFVVDSVDLSSKDSFHTIGFAQMALYSL